MRYDIKHGADAKKEYEAHMASIGEEVEITDCDFVVNADHPWLGASPDGVVSVDGVAQCLLEIKCPYQLNLRKGKVLTRTFYRKAQGSNTAVLHKKHSYFYQVQVQMFVTDLQKCDFVVWSPEWLFVQRVKRDNDFLKDVTEKLSTFPFDHLLTSLVMNLLRNSLIIFGHYSGISFMINLHIHVVL